MAPRPARAARTPRPARAARARRPDPRAATIPSLATMRARGPKPPDAAIAILTRALEADLGRPHADAAAGDPPAPRLRRRWKAALALALASIARGALRGVTAALGAVGAIPPGTSGLEWERDVTEQVQAVIDRHVSAGTLATLLAAAIAVATAAALREHALRVRVLSEAAGSADYIWITQQDERVRPLHVALEGTRQRWAAPPLAGLPNFHGHPGEAAQCRCVPWPLVRREPLRRP
jgi:F like protein